jgi:Xaa-Pro aminopeptidase
MDYRARRRQLTPGLYVLTAYDEMQGQHDMAAPFTQEANFWYMTGITEPGWRVIIDNAADKTILVAPERSLVQQTFDGALDWSVAKQCSQADDVIESKEFETKLRDLARRHSLVQTIIDPIEHEFVINPAQAQLKRTLERIFGAVESCQKLFARLRAIKTPEEIVRIKKAVKLTEQAFTEAREQSRTARYEYEIEASMGYVFRHAGANHAYAPIVAGGAHACTLHYSDNNDRLRQHQLLLIDVGARYEGYAADITRTFAIGTPTKRQMAIHAAVSQVIQQTTALIKPGVALTAYVEQADQYMREALVGLELMSDLHDDERFRRYFPHAISHGLGLDVHESLGGYAEFQPGMVLTVEPGIYVPEQGIGVRLEDDILVTESGHQILSSQLTTDL